MRLRAAWLALALVAAACGDPLQRLPGSDSGPPGPDGACALRPRDTCCFDDKDCDDASGSRCYAASCVAEGEGKCEFPAPAGMCWTAADCAPGQTCQGATICGCGAVCLIADEPGTCVP
jgi:hypothetical protein